MLGTYMCYEVCILEIHTRVKFYHYYNTMCFMFAVTDKLMPDIVLLILKQIWQLESGWLDWILLRVYYNLICTTTNSHSLLIDCSTYISLAAEGQCSDSSLVSSLKD